MMCKNMQQLKVIENSAYARQSGKFIGCNLFPPRGKGAKMRQAGRKVKLSDSHKTMTAEQLFVI